ncbi:MAG: pyruvate ferredoxin oxidoreductase [Hydrogenophilales bacterium CG03_land_8_20_14_0_80_62_28]|nr:pyruvate ferredoxin oxidoreductase [Betaproteobacteria bacterium]OIO79821.1 MAG: pyruvate ferredoxin oxidoreductase [Hydrogenophilaceae bacterium CG1_02_62_390]PIV24330.1 MAG: pyruvate ferredoxin oxidoreductase [Hydrogenophilales bacterium CG03_land_8_20_14_0_80_62_28]PIW38426.1 MAG: pyruvate ferredoxin oxidoreductase [Hydrogenophilales bacterium CG15_BIG_FIL_POST_REV_8_21_14_020_62_31]PIW71873.1 MAG: pyruvate ferredoxin oxidoreductase [Hydrogenophilales bacterium CG12_big_fil_rev_8_21_14_0_
MSTHEIRFSGFGGQGIIRCALITGKALSLYDDKFATMTQSFGPEARGSACAAQLVVSDERVLYPYLTHPGILLALSQEAYDKYWSELPKGGILIVEQDLVKLSGEHLELKLYRVPATRFAEEVGNRLFTNLVALGFLTAVTKVVSAEAMKKALPGLVPDRFLKVNIKAFEKGYEYGLEAMNAGGAAS